MTTAWHIDVDAQVGPLHLRVVLQGDARPLAIVGPNGAGKTTLLRIVAGALRPTRGTIRIGDACLLDTAAGIDTTPQARRVGYVPQGYGLFPHLSVVDNVAFGLRHGARALDRAAARHEATRMLGELDIAELAERMPAGLSGGERQRVALARALVIDPAWLLLDEPLAALDAASRRVVRTRLADRLRRHGAPALVVTHDARDVVALSAEVVVLREGEVVQRGTPQQLRREPVDAFVAELFDAPLDAG